MSSGLSSLPQKGHKSFEGGGGGGATCCGGGAPGVGGGADSGGGCSPADWKDEGNSTLIGAGLEPTISSTPCMMSLSPAKRNAIPDPTNIRLPAVVSGSFTGVTGS